MSIEGKDIQKVEQNVDIETSLQTHGMLMVGLQGAWGGHQGAGHSAGCFVWRWGRGGQRTLQELDDLRDLSNCLGRNHLLHNSEDITPFSAKEARFYLVLALTYRAVSHGTKVGFLPQFPHLFREDKSTCSSGLVPFP